MTKTLVIQLARMGDLLQSSPLIAAVKDRTPHTTITLLVSEETRDMASAIPGVDEVVGIDFGRARRVVNAAETNLSRQHRDFGELLKSIRGRSFDRVYNLNYSLLNARLMGLIRYRQAFCYGLDQTKRRIMRTPWMSYLFSTLDARRLSRFNLVDIYLHAAGLSSAGSSLHYQVDRQILESTGRFLAAHGVTDRGRVIGFQVGSGNPIRRWPLASYAQLAGLLTSREDVSILVFGSPSEIRLGEDLEHRVLQECGPGGGAGEPRIFNLVGKTTRQELAAFVKHCSLLITPDTGTMHLATAVGTRVLAIFLGTAFCHETGPYGEGHLIVHPRLACYPCFEGGDLCPNHRCQSAVSPEYVARVDEAMWQDDGGMRGPRSGIPHHDEVDVLQSRIRGGSVEYVPVQPSPLAVEQVLGHGYRAMWRGVLDNEWSSPQAVIHELLKNHDGNALREDHLRELDRAGTGFENIENECAMGRVTEGGATMGRPGSDRGWERLEPMTEDRGETEYLWIRPIRRFLEVARDDIELGEGRYGMEMKPLLARVARGAAFMKDFLHDTVHTFQSYPVGVTDGVSGEESEHPATEARIASRAG